MNKKEIEIELNKTYNDLKLILEKSFAYMNENPSESEYIANLWAASISDLKDEIVFQSEKYNQKDLIRKVIRRQMFR